MIWLQKRCPQLQESHYDIKDFNTTFFNCCATIIPKPDGIIKRVYTYTLANQCDAIFYQPVTYEAFLSNVRSYLACGKCNTCGTPPNDAGDEYGIWGNAGRSSDTLADKGYRASSGIWTIRDKELLLFPNIESTEHVGVNWKGIKLTYTSTDLIDIPLDAQSVIELYAKMQIALREDCDNNEYLKFKQAVDLASGDLIWWYRNKDETPEMEWRGSGCEMCTIATQGCDEPPPPPPTDTFTVYLGNAGMEAPPSYTEAEILAMNNEPFGITTVRSVIVGTYEIGGPQPPGNAYRLVAIPFGVIADRVMNFFSAGFPLPMVELDHTTVNGVECRVFRTGIPSAGDFTVGGHTAIIIT